MSTPRRGSLASYVLHGAALLLAVTACTPRAGRAPAAGAAPAPGAPAPGDAVTLRILHFNDVYEIGPVEGGRSGGLARVATLRLAMRDSVPSLVTTLGGDYLSPSALGTARVGAERLNGRQMVATLNALGLDVAVLGNHEFDVPEAAFRAHLDRARYTVLGANVLDSAGRPFPGLRSHLIVTREVGGRPVRIGFIGVVITANRPAWVRLAEPLATAADAARRLRDSVDVLVALTHLSVDDDARLAAEVPELDLVLGGHEHENFTLQRGPRLTPVLKSDANVRTVQVVSIVVPRQGRPVVTSRLQPVTSAVRDEPAVAAVVRAYTDSAYAGFEQAGFAPRERVADAPVPLDGREATVRNRSSALTELVGAAVQREAGDVAVWLYNSGSIRVDDVLTPGPVLQYDVIRILPFGGRVVRVQMLGALLRRVLDQGRSNAGTGGYLQTSAVLRADGAWEIGGQPLRDDAWYPVALTDFLLTGNETGLDFLTRDNPELKVERELRDVRQALIDEMRARWK
ncbi:MAG TPA: bifunctional metallophosphatase/5'-nucleotidase [Gemmatimonadaceae bacterium]|nr:bifunctional metallophosphatase/5'-nucleotidase [Gemmatimonadaceae bacterium]